MSLSEQSSSSYKKEEDGISLVARPALHPASFDHWNATRFDHVLLYPESPPQGAAATKTEDEETTTTTTTRRTGTESYRYRLTVVDHPGLHRGSTRSTTTTSTTTTVSLHCATAVFLIPAGRESEYLFRTRRGLQQVCQSAQAGRLIAVALGRSYSDYQTPQTIQDELTFVVQILGRQGTFLPPAHRRSSSSSSQTNTIPFMALNGIGQRNILHQGETACSGPYLIEQVLVEHEQERVRRLYFLSNPFVIQSEVVLTRTTKSNNHNNNDDNDQPMEEWTVDASQVSFEYHRIMAAGLLALTSTSTVIEETSPSSSSLSPPSPPKRRGLIVGLGGGGLLTHLQYLSCHWDWTAVELDAVVARVATDYFGLPSHSSLVHIAIGNGLDLQVRDTADQTDNDDKDKDNDDKPTETNSDDDDNDDDDKPTTTNSDANTDTTIPLVASAAAPSVSDDNHDRSKLLLTYPAGHFSCIVVDVDSKDSTVGTYGRYERLVSHSTKTVPESKPAGTTQKNVGVSGMLWMKQLSLTGLTLVALAFSLCTFCVAVFVDCVMRPNHTTGMSCPPIAFIQLEYLRRLYRLLGGRTTTTSTDPPDTTTTNVAEEPGGILAMNVAARDPAMLGLVCDNISKVFPSMVIADPHLQDDQDQDDDDNDEKDVNVVIFASVRQDLSKLSMAQVQQGLRHALVGHAENAELVADLEQSLLDAISRPTTTNSTNDTMAVPIPSSATKNRPNNNNNNKNHKKGKQKGKKKGKKK